jgi:hypothetical protein
MIFTINSLIVLAGCMRPSWRAEAGGEGGWPVDAAGDGAWRAAAACGDGPIVTAASTTPIMIRMPV